MIHSIRWLGSLVLAAAALVATDAAAQGSPAAPAPESRAPGDSAAAAGDTPAANAADSKADDFDRTPTNCITLSNVKQTAVIDDSTILFYMRGGAKMTYRNTLPHTCPNLSREDRFSYKTTMNRLCNVDLITVLEQWGAGLRDGFTCGLGPFYPITYEEAELLRKEKDKPNSTRGAIKTKPAEVPAKSKAPPAAPSEPTAPSEPAPASEQAAPSDSTPR